MKCYIVWILFLLVSTASAQTITTFAGNGTASGTIGDGGPATAASINGANGGAFDKLGNYYVCDILGHKVRMVSPAGIITTVAGTGTSGDGGDGGPATAAQLDNPGAVVLDTSGNVYISDGNNFKIKKVTKSTGMITTVAGTGISGYNGDNIPATNAQLGVVQDMCIDNIGNLYLADQGNYRVRKINTLGIISTIGGNGGFSATGTGDGGAATTSTFNWIASVIVDYMGNVFVADMNGAKVRKINTSGSISTIAGNGVYTYVGDNIPATAAQFSPMRITLDRSNNIVIADKYNRRVLKVDNVGIIHSIAGNGATGYSGDGGSATAASLDFPAGIVYDTCGNLYIAESTNRRVRKVAFNPDCVPITTHAIKHSKHTNISLHPNPATNTITITTNENMHTLTISNMLGQVVLSAEYSGRKQARVDVSALPPGVYMVRVNDRWVEKMIKR